MDKEKHEGEQRTALTGAHRNAGNMADHTATSGAVEHHTDEGDECMDDDEDRDEGNPITNHRLRNVGFEQHRAACSQLHRGQ